MTKSSYFNWITVTIFFSFVTIGAVCGIYFALISPTEVDYQAQLSTYTQDSPSEGPGPIAIANKAKSDATAKVKVVQDQWNEIVATKNPDIDFSDVMLAWNQYMNEINFTLGASIDQWLPSTGVRPTAPITTPAAPANPNLVVTKNPIIIPLNGGSPITVVGSFPAIMKSIAAWNNFDRIVMVDKVSLRGVSPWITATYVAEVIEFPRNADKVGHPLNSGTGASASGR
jgi:hypothetical protein